MLLISNINLIYTNITIHVFIQVCVCVCFRIADEIKQQICFLHFFLGIVSKSSKLGSNPDNSAVFRPDRAEPGQIVINLLTSINKPETGFRRIAQALQVFQAERENIVKLDSKKTNTRDIYYQHTIDTV